MPELASLQQAFLRWLLEGDERFGEAVEPGGRIATGLRLDIYRNAYRMRLLEALADSFPAVHTLLGDERFSALGLAYLDAHPSHRFSIRWFGHRLPELLGEHPEYREQPVLAEMAAFEWALRDTFDAAEATPTTLEDLRRLAPGDWAGLRFALHPALRLLVLAWNVPQLWSAIDAGEPPIEVVEAPHPIGWVIWRVGLISQFRSLEVDEAWALAAVRDGLDFGGVCAGLTEWVDEVHAPGRAASLVGRWVNDGLIGAVAAGPVAV
jgi:hypothetical protein